MMVGFLLGVFSVAAALAALRSYFKERRAGRWPVITANVVETEPQSLFERSGSKYIFNRDSDHYLEWSVNGQNYRVGVEDEASFVVTGFKLWRRAPKMSAVTLHYNPRKPSEHLLAQDFGAWKALLVVSAVACIGALVAGAV
jgi:hypothetical protein